MQDISLHIGEGELFGLIGPDGAGKTSLFRILTTLLLADSGTASVCSPAGASMPEMTFRTIASIDCAFSSITQNPLY